MGHFGDARYYHHYVYEGGGWRLERRVENPYAGLHERGGGEEPVKRPKILELIRDCTHIVATAFGPGGQEFMEKHGLKVVKVRPGTTIEEALRIVEEKLKD